MALPTRRIVPHHPPSRYEWPRAHSERMFLSSARGHPPREEVQLPLVNQEAGPYMLVALVLEAPWEVVVSVP